MASTTNDGGDKAIVSLKRNPGSQALAPGAVGGIGRRLQNILVASALYFGTRASRLGCEEPRTIVHVEDRKRKESGRSKESGAQRLDTVGATINGQHGQLSINRAVAEFSVEQTSGYDRIKIGFVDGSQLRVMLEAGSIEASYIEMKTGERINIDAAHIREALEGFEVTAVSSASGSGNSPYNWSCNNPCYDKLVFERSDGARVVLLVKPGAIKGIELMEA